MTGTASTSAEEFGKVYDLQVVTIPTNKEIRRTDHNDVVYQTENAKWNAIVEKVKELNEKGQPVLIGTTSIEKNERMAKYFDRAGIRYEMLNAKNHEREGEIISQAGKKGSVVIATNMAGRGVDIKLGGAPTTKGEADKIRDLGGLYVIGTERHEARRIDNQLRGRSGRQGDNGETQFFVSLDDEVMKRFGGDSMKSMMAKLNVPEDMPIEAKMVNRIIEQSQTKIEGFYFDMRKQALQYDAVLNTQRDSVYTKRKKVLNNDFELIEEFFTKAVVQKTELSELRSKMEINGSVTKGLGEGGYYISMPGYKKQIIQMLGFEPYPGTLNVKLDENEIWKREYLVQQEPIIVPGFKEGTRTFGDFFAYKCKIEQEECYIIVPIRTHHGPSVIEIISPISLREKFNLKDNDPVKVII
jgi:preprotein translocase subunit SecA